MAAESTPANEPVPPTEVAELQAEVVRAVVASVANGRDGSWGDRQWRMIVVDHETLLHDAEPRTSTIAVAIAVPGGAAEGDDDDAEAVDFRLDGAAKEALTALNDAMATQTDGRWTSTVVRVRPDGTFRFDFGYGEPYRLSGHPHDTRYDDVLDQYRRGQTDSVTPPA